MRFEKNGSRQSVVKPGDPAHLELEYLRVALIGLALARHPPQRILVVGLGGGSLPVFLHQTFAAVDVDVAEIDPTVLRVAQRFFGVRPDQRLVVHLGDGRAFIERAAPSSYDLIFIDAFGARGMPPQFTTQEFFKAVRSALRPDGVAVTNLWGPDLNTRYHDQLATQATVFDALQLVYTPNDVNVLVFGLPRSERIARDALAIRARALGKTLALRFDPGLFVDTAWLESGRALMNGRVLHDSR